MTFETLLFPMPYDERTVPVRISSELWNRLLRAAEAGGALILERYSPTQARAFALTIRAALEPPAAPSTPQRFAVFAGATHTDPGLPLRDPAVLPDVLAALAVFEQGTGVLVQRATESALRALPGANVPGGGGVGRKAPVGKATGKLKGLSASEVLGPSGR